MRSEQDVKACRDMLRSLFSKEAQQAIAILGWVLERATPLDLTIEKLRLSVRSTRGLEGIGVKTLGDLLEKTTDDLLSAHNFGVTSLNEIRERVSELGFTLKDESL